MLFCAQVTTLECKHSLLPLPTVLLLKSPGLVLPKTTFSCHSVVMAQSDNLFQTQFWKVIYICFDTGKTKSILAGGECWKEFSITCSFYLVTNLQCHTSILCCFLILMVWSFSCQYNLCWVRHFYHDVVCRWGYVLRKHICVSSLLSFLFLQ